MCVSGMFPGLYIVYVAVLGRNYSVARFNHISAFKAL